MNARENQIVVYQPNATVRLDVRLENETVWLNQARLGELFCVDRTANGAIKLDNVDYVDEKEFDIISKRCNPKRNDVLISCSGSVGRCCVVEDDNKYVMVRSAAMVSLIKVHPKWVMYCIHSTALQKQISNKAKATAQANLFQEPIKRLVLPLPPLAEQRRIVERLDEVLKLIEAGQGGA